MFMSCVYRWQPSATTMTYVWLNVFFVSNTHVFFNARSPVDSFVLFYDVFVPHKTLYLCFCFQSSCPQHHDTLNSTEASTASNPVSRSTLTFFVFWFSYGHVKYKYVNFQYTIFKKCNFVKIFHHSSFSVTNISLFLYEMGITYY